jgi:hypothetical protein
MSLMLHVKSEECAFPVFSPTFKFVMKARKVRKVNYLKVDWSMTNSAIADKYGVARATIRKARLFRGIPPVPNPQSGRRRRGSLKRWKKMKIAIKSWQEIVRLADMLRITPDMAVRIAVTESIERRNQAAPTPLPDEPPPDVPSADEPLPDEPPPDSQPVPTISTASAPDEPPTDAPSADKPLPDKPPPDSQPVPTISTAGTPDKPPPDEPSADAPPPDEPPTAGTP